ncbi:protease SohB [Acanthopleuribacter pedis]|uniref:Protease SohB n=1 Tax=Acanthopleuribacter pedis TaxID=442870 RepID=A0A8J7Q5K2_9BACT|nr:protease SohB [Acanthopleuribacter pedis]MBO1318376.1 protease SohB [Acanthopleuribacter pedis]
MEFILEIVGFVVKAGIVTLAVGAVILLLSATIRRNEDNEIGSISVVDLGNHLDDLVESVRYAVMDRKTAKDYQKTQKKEQKHKTPSEKNLYVLDFDGDIAATQVGELREQVTAVLGMADPEKDEVVVRLESSGGMVHQYGLAAAQLARLREKKIPLTVCIDRVAASGGYMMACIADRILAPPFAILGSIGVIAMFPNFHRLLKKHDVDYLEMTSGEFKRTLSPLGEVTEKGREKFQSELEDTHQLFKDFVTTYRPAVDVDKIATGETWYGTRALEQKLIDRLLTSDDYLLERRPETNIYLIRYDVAKSVRERVTSTLTSIGAGMVKKVWTEMEERARFRAE